MKTRVYRYFITAMLLISGALAVSAQQVQGDSTYVAPEDASILPDSVIYTHRLLKISYRVNRADLDKRYMNNAHDIAAISHSLSSTKDKVDSVLIYSYASPEGRLSVNMQLAQMRGETAKRLIRQIFRESGGDNDNVLIRQYTRGENWGDLYNLAERSYSKGDRDKLLGILKSDMPKEEQKKALRNLGRESWGFIIDRMMPQLRSAEVVIFCSRDTMFKRRQFLAQHYERPPMFYEDQEPKITMRPAEIHYSEPVVFAEEPEYEWRTRIAAKTNMLYDALTWTNLSAEVPFKIKKGLFSITYDHQFPWWRVGEGNNKYCNRYLQIGGEARWWFAPQKKARTKKNIKRECLAGHFFGLYGMGGKYDFEWSRKICYQGEFWSAGLTYGYSMPISKVFNLEFSVSVGYASIDYRHFIPSDDFDILYRDPDKMGRLDYFGVTKLGVSLVLPINFKHKVRKEAGR